MSDTCDSSNRGYSLAHRRDMLNYSRSPIGARIPAKMPERYCSASTEEHRQSAPPAVRCVVITVSDTRTPATDKGGPLIVEGLQGAGHTIVAHEIVPDDPDPLRTAIEKYARALDVDAILLTGGTGIATRDQTPETVAALFTKELPGYGELFRMLSYQEIGAAAMLSRAAGGVVGDTILLTMSTLR